MPEFITQTVVSAALILVALLVVGGTLQIVGVL